MKDSNELFELCKQVYEATGWKYTIGRFHDDGSYDGYVGHRGIAYTPNPQNAEWLPKDIPLYSSDYLLERLKEMRSSSQLRVILGDANWHCEVVRVGRKTIWAYSDTPLKALLKLTIALSEAGELDNE